MNKPTTILLREQSWQDFLIAKNIEMSKKMSDILSNTIKVIISFFVALFLNKILSIFRKRQLYLSCWNSLENTSISDNACTINASIYNNGKEKEKNVVIQMPSGMECSALSCNYDYKNASGSLCERASANGTALPYSASQKSTNPALMAVFISFYA